MSLCRDMMPAWELRAALDASEAECTALRAEIERLRAALRDIADGLGETDLAEVGRYAKHIARAALKEDGDE